MMTDDLPMPPSTQPRSLNPRGRIGDSGESESSPTVRERRRSSLLLAVPKLRSSESDLVSSDNAVGTSSELMSPSPPKRSAKPTRSPCVSSLPDINECSPRGVHRRARQTSTDRADSVAAEDETRSVSSRRSSSTSRSSVGRERSNSTARRSGGAGLVRELFRIQIQLQHIGHEETIAREDVVAAEALGFSQIFQLSTVTRLVMGEILQRALIVKEEVPVRALLHKQASTGLETLRKEQARAQEKEAAAAQQVCVGDNRLYDRMVRKRKELGLQDETSKAMVAESAKSAAVAQLGKTAATEDIAKLHQEIDELEQTAIPDLQSRLEGKPGALPNDKRLYKQWETDLKKKKERLAKLKEMVARHEEREEIERRRAERAVHMKGVDTDVLTGKKTVVSSKLEKDLERKRKQHEEEIEIALRRALQNEKKSAAVSVEKSPTTRQTAKLPAVSQSAELLPPSVPDKPLNSGRRRASSAAVVDKQ